MGRQRFTGTLAPAVMNVFGPVNIDTPAPVSVPNVNLFGGSLGGSADLTVSGTLNWTGGTMGGTGATVIAGGATASLTGGQQKALNRTLDNSGAFELNVSNQISVNGSL